MTEGIKQSTFVPSTNDLVPWGKRKKHGDVILRMLIPIGRIHPGYQPCSPRTTITTRIKLAEISCIYSGSLEFFLLGFKLRSCNFNLKWCCWEGERGRGGCSLRKHGQRRKIIIIKLIIQFHVVFFVFIYTSCILSEDNMNL